MPKHSLLQAFGDMGMNGLWFYTHSWHLLLSATCNKYSYLNVIILV